eukprot:1071560-Prymnesium_polylepis.1
MHYVGRVTSASHGDSIGYVEDAADYIVAQVDYGRGFVRDPKGSVLVEFSRDGALRNGEGCSCGRVSGFEWPALRAVAAYLVLVDPQLAMPHMASVLTVWQRQQVTRDAVAEALASLDDVAVVRLVEHGMLQRVERLQRRSVAQDMEPGEQGDAKEQQYARALGVLYEQAERGGVRAVMNIFLYALLGPSDHMRTMPTVATQKAVLRGLLFVSSLATSREYGGAERTDGGDGKGVEDTDGGERDEGGAECHKGGSEGGEADVGNSSLCGIRPGEATSNVSEMAR